MATGSIVRKYGNTTYYFLSQGVDKKTLIYQQIEKSEFDRIKNNTYQDEVNGEVQSIEGNAYTNTLNGKNYAFVGFYDVNGNYQSTGLSSTESQYGSVSNSIQNDKDLKKLLVGSQNTNPTNPNQPGTPGTSTPTSPPNENPTIDPAILKYPIKMKDDQDRIMFQAYDYKSSSRLGGLAQVKPVLTSPIGQSVGPAVILPIQSSITDQNAVGWEPDTLNPIEMAAANASLRLMNKDSNVTQVASDEFNTALRNLRSSTPQIRTYLAGQAIGVNNLLSRLNGQILNPNLELLFQGVQLRPFNFTFKLSPRSADEAKVVKKIIRYFKQNMAPIVGDTSLFLEAPNVFKIQYQYKSGTEHPGLNKIKECALTNCSVDYTPNGTYMTYPEGTMVSYTLSLQFQELEPVYSRDYTNPDQIEF